MEINKEYENLRKKYSLPTLNELDIEYNIGKIEESNNLLRIIINKIAERTEHVIKILGEIIQPETHITSMYETQAFDEEEKKQIFETLKKLASIHAELIINDFQYNESKAAETITRINKEWKQIKPSFIKTLEKIRKAWTNKEKISLQLGYFG